MAVVLWGGRKGDVQYNSKLDRKLWRMRADRIDMVRAVRSVQETILRSVSRYRTYEEQKEIRDRPRRPGASNHQDRRS